MMIIAALLASATPAPTNLLPAAIVSAGPPRRAAAAQARPSRGFDARPIATICAAAAQSLDSNIFYAAIADAYVLDPAEASRLRARCLGRSLGLTGGDEPIGL